MGIPLVIFLVFALVSYAQTRWIQQSLERITEIERPRSSAASEMEIDLVKTGFELLGYLQDRDPKRLELIEITEYVLAPKA